MWCIPPSLRLVLVVFMESVPEVHCLRIQGVSTTSHSPSWLGLSHPGRANFSRGLGVVEVATALLIAVDQLAKALDCRQPDRNWNVPNYLSFVIRRQSMAGRVWIPALAASPGSSCQACCVLGALSGP